jgi:hypothetical protein
MGLGALLLGAFSVAAGCSSSDSKAAPAADAGAEAAPAATGTLDLIVADTYVRAADKKPKPLAGASVTFYPPGDEPAMEATSGPDGKVSFKGIDWSKGKGSLVAYAPNRTIAALTDVHPDTIATVPRFFDVDGLVLTCERLTAHGDFIDVGGNLTNKADPKHYVTLGATGLGTTFQAPTAAYTIRVPKDQAFTVFATEWQPEKTAPAIQTFFKWVKVDAPANTTKVDVDFATATALTTTKTSRTLVISGGASGPLGGATAYYSLIPADSSAPLGYAISQQPAPDGSSVALGVETVTNPGVPLIAYNLLQKSDGAVSLVSEVGAPVDGATIDNFLAPPAVTIDKASIKDPIQIDGLDPKGSVVLQVFNVDFESLLVIGTLGKGSATSVTITPPKLPAGALALIGNQAMTARAAAQLGDFLPGTDYVGHFAASRTFTATR